MRVFAGNVTWFVQSGDRFALFIVGGTFPPPGDEVRARVGDTVLAGLLHFSAWTPLASGSSVSESPSSDASSPAAPKQGEPR